MEQPSGVAISNTEQLKDYCYKSFNQALRRSMKRALNKLHEIIENDVYYNHQNYSYEGEIQYDRTMEALNNWEVSRVHRIDGDPTIELTFEKPLTYANPDFDEKPYSHTGINGQPLDNEEFLEILNEDATHVDLYRELPVRKKFWDEFEVWFESNLRDIFVAESQGYGMKVSANFNEVSLHK